METIKSAFKKYCEKETPLLFLTNSSNDSWVDYILKGRSEDAKQQFRDALIVIRSKINQQSSVEECISICEEILLPIKGIGEKTALRCAMYLANQFDIDPEANCVCFLTGPAKKALEERGWIRGKKIRISKSIQKLIADYSPLLFVDFTNKHYRIILNQI